LPDNGIEITVIDGETPTIRLSGEVDYHNAQKIRETVARLLRGNTSSLVIDVANLDFIDSSGLSALLDASKAALALGGEIKLLSPGDQLIHVLTISGFARFFSITPSDRGATPEPPVVPQEAVEQSAWQVSQFVVAPRTELIADIRNRVARFAQGMPFSEQDIQDIRLAVGEASSNALRYGCPGANDQVMVRCAHDGRTLRVQIKDKGPCFEPDSIEPPPVDALDEGGRGIYFMRILMDDVKFYFSNSGTIVELTKRCR
jgi:anti-anti-sigma factor